MSDSGADEPSPNRPVRVVLTCGPAGSGKTTHAHRLEASGYVRISFDEEAWRLGHRTHPLPAAAAATVHAVIRGRLLGLVREGRDVVVDTSFWSRASRDAYRQLLAPLGITPVTHYLATSQAQMLDRLARRGGAGPHQVVVPPDLARAYLDGFEVPTAEEGPLVVVMPD